MKKIIEKFDEVTWMTVFILLQPMIDIYRHLFGGGIEILGISLLELINYMLILLLVILLFLRDGWKKHYFWFVGYLFIVGIYCVIHSYNVSLFDASLLNRQTYSLVKETYYIARTYMLPLVFLVLVYKSRLDKVKFYRIISISTFLIAGMIIVTNLLGMSLTAYGDEFSKQMIQGNMFSWFQFKEGMDFELYTSKGWFSSANQISGVLFILCPLVIKQMLEEVNVKNVVLAFMCMVSMIMLGTKTATFGFFIVLFVLILAAVVLGKLKFGDLRLKSILGALSILLILGSLLLYHSPYLHLNAKSAESSGEEREIQVDEEELAEYRAHADSLEEYINKYYWNYYIQDQLIAIYPVENDLEFWEDKITRDVSLNQNYRLIKTELLQRIVERNHQPLDELFGIGYMDKIDNERDYVYQSFLFGKVGVALFIGPYLLIFLYAVIKWKKNRFSFEGMALLCSCGIAITVPYVTGHMFGIAYVMTYISFIYAYTLKVKEKV